MPQLHTFIFYISTNNIIDASLPRQSNLDIQQTFTNINYGQTACVIDYFNDIGLNAICHVYSLPFTFTRLEKITNGFPTILFDTNQAFQRLNDDDKWKSDENSSYSVIEYSHLTSLDMTMADFGYIEQFLLETKTYLPCLTHVNIISIRRQTINSIKRNAVIYGNVTNCSMNKINKRTLLSKYIPSSVRKIFNDNNYLFRFNKFFPICIY
ncbi:unnamed protein product [Rotaria sordida]|uniref:Uncharacterized protein n=1 Tax=Rotaria sordida TaxID=392033 RepID=A0A819SPI8_9BILA|nr:unnamed protein product [Rotaria sordida]